MAERILVDTGPIVAIFSKDDAHHDLCAETLESLTPPLLSCWPVLTEAAWLLRARPEVVEKLFAALEGGLFALLPLVAGDIPGVASFLKRYRSAHLQLADAALAHLAEREGIRRIFTLDRRDFTIVRLKGNRRLRLIPQGP